MVVDLKLLPIEISKINISYSQTVLKLDRDREFFDRLMDKELEKTVNSNFRSYVSRRNGKGSHYGITEKDAYGDPVNIMSVAELEHQFAWHQTEHKISPRNEAVLAYLKALDPKTEVALFWH